MKVFYVVGAIFATLVIYFLLALAPLPWYIYPPFVVLFGCVFYWDKIEKYIPFDVSGLGKYFKLRSLIGNKGSKDTDGTKHKGGKRI
ncbi:MAG: hypothetical protein B6I36_06380 [Desulfobacteraceae bacterium 4572_35.1]|nr:MAG: hypothetical protein B6I36_06380 [Desulfobacteraceae bacterium 4572_35.1]